MITPYEQRNIAMLIFEQAQTLDITGPLEVFSEANHYIHSQHPTLPAPYQLDVLAEQAGLITVSSGIQLNANNSYHNYRNKIDTLLIAGGGGVEQALLNKSLLKFLQRSIATTRRVASVCTGAYLLAETGVLNNKKATTHWRHTAKLQERYPSIQVEPDAIFIKQGSIYTSAGVTAGIDLALSLVEEDLGKKTALHIARELIVFLKRPGGQSQFSQFLKDQSSDSHDFSELSEWLLNNIHQPITVNLMAERCSMSLRNFARQFQDKMNRTPAKHLEQMRLEKARFLLEQSDIPHKTVITQCGFVSHEHMRRCFQRNLHINPQDYCKHF